MIALILRLLTLLPSLLEIVRGIHGRKQGQPVSARYVRHRARELVGLAEADILSEMAKCQGPVEVTGVRRQITLQMVKEEVPEFLARAAVEAAAARLWRKRR